MSLSVYRLHAALGKLVEDGHADARIMIAGKGGGTFRPAALEPTPILVKDDAGVQATAVALGAYGQTYKAVE